MRDEVMDEPKTTVDAIERIVSMTQEEVDDLPYGFIVLDEAGTILLYNRYEARMSRVPPERVVGRNFFSDVAPCTRVDAFQGRFRALVADPAQQSERFAFRFHFLHGAQDVLVQLTRVPEGAIGPLAGARVLMTVERRPVTAEGVDLAPALALDPARGRAAGPLGAVFPLGAAQLASILHRLGASAARAIGRAIGESIAAVAERQAREAGVAGLHGAPVLLVAGTLDEALATAGLGRLALDLTPREDNGVIGCLVRPAVMGSRPLALLYEGLLEAALGAALGEPLAARCLEGGDAVAIPWRYALGPAALAARLAPGPGERARDVARRLGLLEDDAP